MTVPPSRYDTDPDALALALAKARELENVPAAVTFGLRVLALRTGRKWSRAGMASRCGLTVSMLRRVERGENFTFATAEKVAAAFGKPLWVMLAPDGEAP